MTVRFFLNISLVVSTMICLWGCNSGNGRDSLAVIECTKNYLDTAVSFRVETDGYYDVQCSAEILDKDFKPEWQGECLGLYFDVNNDKDRTFGGQQDDRSFNISMSGDSSRVKYRFLTKGKNAYAFECFLTWQNLGSFPKPGDLWGFDMVFADNDGRSGREPSLSWHADDVEFWMNSSLFGNMKFIGPATLVAEMDDVMYCPRSNTDPILDGMLDKSYDYSLQKSINRVLKGNMEGDSDCQVIVTSCWTESGLFIYCDVKDDSLVFSPTPICNIVDRGWITDETGDIVWEVFCSQATHADGASRNRVVNDRIKLAAGNYQLHFVSDESHSPDSWDVEPPGLGFYGIKVSSPKDVVPRKSRLP